MWDEDDGFKRMTDIVANEYQRWAQLSPKEQEAIRQEQMAKRERAARERRARRIREYMERSQ